MPAQRGPFTNGIKIEDGYLMAQDVDGRQLGPVHGLEVPAQVVGPRNRRFVARDEDVMTGLDVQVGDGLADEAGAARDDDVHVIRRVGGAQEKGRGSGLGIAESNSGS